jgi:hypothetical protein
MVEEASAYVQGESLKADATLLREVFQLPDRQQGNHMLTTIGVTLVFAGTTSALGIPRAVDRLRLTGPHWTATVPLAMHVVMAVWFIAAGMWALV